MGRKFVRMSLGGIHDRGRRSAAIGAPTSARFPTDHPEHQDGRHEQPGVHARRGRQDRDGLPGRPEFGPPRGPRSQQNNTFQDNYLEVPFDLSKVLFVATANLLDPIPAGAARRMEIVQLHGYTEQEKIQIGKRFSSPSR